MAECSHQRWQGRQTFTYEERRCLDCGEVIRRKIDRTAGEIPRLPWPELKEEDDNGRDTSPGPHRREVAAAANNTYRDAVTAAAQAGAYAAGVQRAGTAKWQTRAKVLGTARFGPGVAAAADDYSRGFAPIREGIAAARLSPRGPRRDPRNRTRINEMLDSIIRASQRSKGTARR